MKDLKLYHLMEGHVEKTLPLLISKIYDSGQSINIVSSNNARLQSLDTLLWTYTPISFLPHGYEATDLHAEDHPIWLSGQPLASKEVLVLFCDFVPANLGAFRMGVLLSQTEQEKQVAEQIAHQAPSAQIKRWMQTEKGWEPY